MSTPLMDREIERARRELEDAWTVYEETPGADPYWPVAYHRLMAAQARFEALLVEAQRGMRQ